VPFLSSCYTGVTVEPRELRRSEPSACEGGCEVSHFQKVETGNEKRELFEREALPHVAALYPTALRLARITMTPGISCSRRCSAPIALFFLSLTEARATIEAWRDDYNHCRPHSTLGALTPVEFAQLKTENLIPPLRGKMITDSTYELTGIGEQNQALYLRIPRVRGGWSIRRQFSRIALQR
jgi:hypothetical protein